MNLAFEAPGPVAARFLQHWGPPGSVSAIMGPVGSAKTSVCLWKGVYAACRQAPSPVDGVRYFKLGVVRDTYRQLRKTTQVTWNRWFPKTLGSWSGEEPATHHIRAKVPGVGIIDFTVEFMAMGESSAEDVLRGWEGSALYLNETDLLAAEVLIYGLGRLGRYPGGMHGQASWWGAWADFNAPDFENHCYENFVENLPDGWAFFRQPSGFSAQAENRQNLPAGYYENQAKGQPDWYIRRFIENEFGYSREGLPVYPEFSDAFNVAGHELQPNPGRRLIIGADAGGTPAAVIRQNEPDGQRRVLDEITCAPDEITGPRRFGERLNTLLHERYPDFRPEEIIGSVDPSAAWGADEKAGERNWIRILSDETGVPFRPAPGNNDVTLRQEAVRQSLRQTVDAGRPGLLLSLRCKVLRKAYNGGYRFKKKASGDREYKPEKNAWSHVAEADQYAALGGGELVEVMGRKRARGGGRVEVVGSDYDPLGGF